MSLPEFHSIRNVIEVKADKARLTKKPVGTGMKRPVDDGTKEPAVGAEMKRPVDDGTKESAVEEVPTALPQPLELCVSFSESRPSAVPIVQRFFKSFRESSSRQDHASTPRSRQSLESQTRPIIDNRESPHVAKIRELSAALDEERASSAGLEAANNTLNADLHKLNNLSSVLAKENAAFRNQLQIEDEETLLGELAQLHNNIRSWCFAFHQKTSNSRSKGSLPQLPHHSKKVSYSPVEKDSILVAYGLAAVWELLVDRVFEYPVGQDARDLWTTRANAQALKHLENVFVASLGKAPDSHPSCVSDSSPRY
jgi:hypothetical protein